VGILSQRSAEDALLVGLKSMLLVTPVHEQAMRKNQCSQSRYKIRCNVSNVPIFLMDGRHLNEQ